VGALVLCPNSFAFGKLARQGGAVDRQKTVACGARGREWLPDEKPPCRCRFRPSSRRRFLDATGAAQLLTDHGQGGEAVATSEEFASFLLDGLDFGTPGEAKDRRVMARKKASAPLDRNVLSVISATVLPAYRWCFRRLGRNSRRAV